jgi:BlaI family transcriptional regulator, penicillinase repressor
VNREPVHITDTELAVLKVLWDDGPVTAREVTAVLYPACSESDIGTVHSMLQRLERKQLVSRDRSRRPHQFSPLISREEVAGQELEAIAERLTDGSLVPFLTHLVDTDRLSEDDLSAVRRLLRQRSTRKGQRE